MNTITLYKNPYPYPYYGNIAKVDSISATPRNQDIKSGFVDLRMTFNEVTSFNYISFKRQDKIVYAWVTNVEERGGNLLFRVHYDVDPFRTYRGDLVYGTQFIERSPTPTLKYDPLLGSNKEINDYSHKIYSIGNPGKRYAVVQTRVRGTDETFSSTPVQPSPYRFYFCEYNTDDWTSSQPIRNFMSKLSSIGETQNIVTLYSIPYIKIDDLAPTAIIIQPAGGEAHVVNGWHSMLERISYKQTISNFTPLTIPSDLTKVKHSVMLVFPEAGIINIPDELLYVEGLGVRQDIDLFSGACNYMLASDNGNKPYHLSVRGGSVSSIPIISDPFDTYISQNQNTLITSLLGDVASVGMGAIRFSSGDPAGMASVGAGFSNLLSKGASLADAENRGYSNPPAFLGTALATNFHQRFWQITIKTSVDNQTLVNSTFGYPYEKISTLTPPTSGFIKTQNCNLSSNGNVPLWAINEINQLFNNGILFK